MSGDRGHYVGLEANGVPPRAPSQPTSEAGCGAEDASGGTENLTAPLIVAEFEIDDGFDRSLVSPPIALAKPGAAASAGLAQSGPFSQGVNLANTILGAGLLGLPRAFAESGYAVGTLLMLLAGVGTSIGLHLLAVSQATVGVTPSSFYTVANAALPSLTVLIDVAVALKCFGVATSYLIVVGDLMPDAVAQLGGSSSRLLWVAVGFVAVAPLSFLRTLDALKFASTAALAFVVFLVLFVLLYAAGVPGLDPCGGDRDGLAGGGNSTEAAACRGDMAYAVTDLPRTLKNFTVFVFAFTCQQNIFAVCSELRNATIRRVDRVIGAAVAWAWAASMTVAAGGFATFGSEVRPDLLTNYPRSTIVSVARVAISLLVVLSYPLQAHPARRCMLSLYASLRHGKRAAASSPDAVPSNLAFNGATSLFLSASFVVAMSVTDLGKVMGLVGATGSTAVSYILPGCIYWRLHPHPHPWRWVAGAQFAVGCCIVPIALTFILW